MIPALLSSPLFFGVGIPVLFLLAGALAKKLVRRAPGWEQEDFYIGLEATLAAISSGLVNIFDLIKRAADTKQAVNGEMMGATGGFLAVTFFLLLLLLAIHQEWQDVEDNPGRKFLMLGVVSNLVGLALMGGFIVGIKGLS